MIDSLRYPRLSRIDSPSDLRQFDASELPAIAEELRAYLIESVGRSGGHFGAGLGVIELTVALHYVYATPDDRIVWDVGHQTYPHKILTGRRDAIHTVKQKDGVAPFPKREESEFDTFGVGHSSTSISAALGMAIANARAFEEIERLRARLEVENAYLREDATRALAGGDLVGSSPGLATVLEQVALVAPTDALVAELHVAVDLQVSEGAILIRLEE